MQQKNLMLFTILSLATLLGWLWVQQQLWPPPPRKTPEAKYVLPTKVPYAVNLIAQALPFAGVEDAARLALALDVSFGPRQAISPPSIEPKETPKVVAKPVEDKIQTIALGGGPKHHLEALLTTRGGGVQKLTLNKFKGADWLGRPEDKPLELIQDDAITPSFLFYHYPEPKAEHPLPAMGEMVWTLESTPPKLEDDKQEVRFSAAVPGYPNLRIQKIYSIEPGAYHLGLTLEIKDERDPTSAEHAATPFRYQLAGAHGLPIEGEWYTSIFRNSVIGVVDSRGNLWRDLEESSRISFRAGGDRAPAQDLSGGSSEGFLQYAGVMTQFFSSMIVVDDKQVGGVDPRKLVAWARPTLESTEKSGSIVAFSDNELILKGPKGFLETFYLLPRVVDRLRAKEDQFKEGDLAVVSFYQSAGKKIATWVRRGQTPLPSFDDVTVRVQSQVLEVTAGKKIVHKFLLFHGPVKVRLLGQMTGDETVPTDLVDRYVDTLQLKRMTDYGRFWLWTDLIIACTNIMHWLLNHLRFFGDGVSIILLTVLVRGLMFPISRKQAYFSVKMQELAPEMKKLAEKYKNDAKARTEATMELYRKHNVHPLGGCLPIFLQMPIFIGLYFALQESIFFRLAGFLWMDNLAAPDMLVYWTESIPLLSDPSNRVGSGGSFIDAIAAFFYLGPYFNLLPIIAVALMVVQQKVMTPPPQDEQQAMQFKMMRYMMVVMGLLFYKVAAGLCIYFIASSAWGLAERRFLPKKKLAPSAAAPPPGPRGPNQRGLGPSGRKTPVKAPEKKTGRLQKVRAWWEEVLKQARKK